jgi:hypothetical protein
MRSVVIVLLVALTTSAIVWCVGVAALQLTGLPKDFPPFTTLPLLSGAAAKFLGGSIIYALIAAFATNPGRVFFFVAICALALSSALPLRLSFTKCARFAEVTPSVQMVLAYFTQSLGLQS